MGWWGRETGRIQKERSRVNRHIWVPTQGRYNTAMQIVNASNRGILWDAFTNTGGDYLYYVWKWPDDFISLTSALLCLRGTTGTGTWDWAMECTGIVLGDNVPSGIPGDASDTGSLSVTQHEVYELDLTASLTSAVKVAGEYMGLRMEQTSGSEDAAALGLSLTYLADLSA